MLWRERYRVAAAGVLAGTALLAVFDSVARAQTDPPGLSVLYLALALALSALYAGFTDWNRIRPIWRLLPALGSMLAVLAAIFWADSAATAHASIGLAAVTVLTLTYVGFVLPPGSALFFSPVVVLILLSAHLREEFWVSLALPLVAVPVSALLGELVSALTDRSLRTASRFSSRQTQLSRLEDVLRRFTRPSSLEEAAHEVAEAAVDIFQVERATVVLRDNEGDLIQTNLGPSRNEIPAPETAQLVAETIGGDEPRLVPTGGPNEHVLVLPLPAADVPAGAVVVHPLTPDDPEFVLDLARLFGTQVGIAIEHLFVIERLERATTRDELTGIGNRKHADALLDSLEEGDALILLDLDGFKEVNDTLGHAAGDQVLQDLSAHLRHCLRDSDTSARLGGDEFLVVAHRAFADPLAVADRILIGWSTKPGSTTISAGVALHEPDMEAAETMERADQALYQAKAAGKNRAHRWYEGMSSQAVDPAFEATPFDEPATDEAIVGEAIADPDPTDRDEAVDGTAPDEEISPDHELGADEDETGLNPTIALADDAALARGEATDTDGADTADGTLDNQADAVTAAGDPTTVDPDAGPEPEPHPEPDERVQAPAPPAPPVPPTSPGNGLNTEGDDEPSAVPERRQTMIGADDHDDDRAPQGEPIMPPEPPRPPSNDDYDLVANEWVGAGMDELQPSVTESDHR